MHKDTAGGPRFEKENKMTGQKRKHFSQQPDMFIHEVY